MKIFAIMANGGRIKMAAMMTKLEPCPFCGDTCPVLVEDRNQYKIYCDNPDCDCQYGWCADREYIIKGWNRRVYDSK